MEILEEKCRKFMTKIIKREEEQDTVLEMSEKVTVNQKEYVKQAFMYAQLKKDNEALIAKNNTLLSDNAELKAYRLINDKSYSFTIKKMQAEIDSFKDSELSRRLIKEHIIQQHADSISKINDQRDTISKLNKEILKWKDKDRLWKWVNDNANNRIDKNETIICDQNKIIDGLKKENNIVNMEKSESEYNPYNELSGLIKKYEALKDQFQKIELKAKLWKQKADELTDKNIKLIEKLDLRDKYISEQDMKVDEQKKSELGKEERYVKCDQSFSGLKQQFNVLTIEYTRLLQIAEDSNDTIESLRIELADEQDKNKVLNKLRTDRTEVDKRNTELINKNTELINKLYGN